MRVAAKGNYWVRVNNLTKMESNLTSYDGYNTLKEAKEVRDRWAAVLLPCTSNGNQIYTVMVEDKDGNILYPEV